MLSRGELRDYKIGKDRQMGCRRDPGTGCVYGGGVAQIGKASGLRPFLWCDRGKIIGRKCVWRRRLGSQSSCFRSGDRILRASK